MSAINQVKKPNILLLTPLAGILVFTLFYIWAAAIYPGGSQFDKQAEGFSLLRNYWCDLFDPIAHNGTMNPSRPIAMVAMILLTTSFGLLWYLLPRLFDTRNNRQRSIQYTGIASMTIAAFLFTPYHELVIDLAGLLGSLALSLTFIELYRNGYRKLFVLGLVCLFLCGFNYFVYETKIMLYVLAVTQKITFLMFFIWAGWINLVLYQKVKARL